MVYDMYLNITYMDPVRTGEFLCFFRAEISEVCSCWVNFLVHLTTRCYESSNEKEM